MASWRGWVRRLVALAPAPGDTLRWRGRDYAWAANLANGKVRWVGPTGSVVCVARDCEWVAAERAFLMRGRR